MLSWCWRTLGGAAALGGGPQGCGGCGSMNPALRREKVDKEAEARAEDQVRFVDMK